MKAFDFSCKHDVWIRNPDGTLQRMDEPYFSAELIAPDTWLVRSDGDFSYLLAGDREAILIDSGYGCGNIRAYCSTLTDKPLSKIANTHDHFDHTANNGYFELAYMSEDTYRYATTPFQSFEGIYFPKDYKVEMISDGYVIDLGGRTLEVLEMADHGAGSLVFLDRKARIVFTGDEFMKMGKLLNGTVEHWMKCMKKMEAWDGAYDKLYGGVGEVDPKVVGWMKQGCRRILDGEEGEPFTPKAMKRDYVPDPEGLGRVIVERFLPRPGDGNHREPSPTMRVLDVDGYPIAYDSSKIFDR